MSEKELQNKIISLLKRNDILYYKTHGGLIYNAIGTPKRNGYFYNGDFRIAELQKGFSDLVVFETYKHKMVVSFIELKSDIGKLREDQVEFKNKIEKINGDFFVLRPNQWEDFKRVFKDNKVTGSGGIVWWTMQYLKANKKGN